MWWLWPVADPLARQVVDAGQNDGDVTSYLHPCRPNLPKAGCVISLGWSCWSLLLARHTPNPPHWRKNKKWSSVTFILRSLRNLLGGFQDRVKLLKAVRFTVPVVPAADPDFFSVTEGLQRHSVNCWLTYITRIQPFQQGISRCKMSFELKELVSVVTYCPADNIASWVKKDWTLPERQVQRGRLSSRRGRETGEKIDRWISAVFPKLFCMNKES